MGFSHPGKELSGTTSAPTRLRAFAERFAFLGLILLALGMPYERLTPLLRGPGVVVTNLEALILFTLVAWGLHRLITPRKAFRRTRFALPLGLMLSAALLAALTAPAYRVNALKNFARLLTGVAIFRATCDLCTSSYENTTADRRPLDRRRSPDRGATGSVGRPSPIAETAFIHDSDRPAGHGASPQRATRLTQALAVSGWAVALLGLLEMLRIPAVLRFLDQFRAIPATFGGAMRVSSTLASANPAALVLAVTGCLSLGWAIHALHRRAVRAAFLWTAGTITLVTALVLTLSRGGLLAFAVGGCGLIAANRRRVPRRWLVSVAAIGLIGIGVLLARSEALRVRLTEFGNRTGFDVVYLGPAAITLPPGDETAVSITLVNTGKRTWTATGDNAVRLGVHWLGADGTDIRWEGTRVPLPTSVVPGQRVTVSYPLQAPSRPGRYVLAWDLVQGEENWFAYWWIETGQTELVVAPGAQVALGPTVSLRQTLRLPADHMPRPSPHRLDLWRVAWRIGMERPWLGVGPDNFRLVYGSYLGFETWDVRFHAHNLFLEFLADTGWLGLLAWLWIALQSLRIVQRLIRRPTVPGYAGIGAGLLAWWTHNLVDVFIWATPTYVLFWMLLGLAATADRNER